MLYIDAYRYFTSIEESKMAILRNSFYESAIMYTKLRLDWFLADKEEKIIIDKERTSAHNTFIDACNILSRNMIQKGEDSSWRKDLGNDRQTIGDFACYISCFLGIRAR